MFEVRFCQFGALQYDTIIQQLNCNLIVYGAVYTAITQRAVASQGCMYGVPI